MSEWMHNIHRILAENPGMSYQEAHVEFGRRRKAANKARKERQREREKREAEKNNASYYWQEM